jgi:diaminohydroxyphosphoribosylaminopyrimidine deaminase/5-amino-6-(5-phosphoribosylamino)uracil reductase
MAARAALRGWGRVEPNPPVGCVLVRDGEVLGIGHHRYFGGSHAEVEAIEACRRRGGDTAGSTAYVTLEPCCHFGKTPPCTDALLRAGVARVVAAASDPNPPAAGGAEVLRRAGVVVEFSQDSPLASGLSTPFRKRVATGMPWVIAKWAQTLDGRIATRTGASRWISGAPARRRVQRLRGRVDAVLTGVGTVRGDDPLLTVREGPRPRRVPMRVVLDPKLETPLASRIVQTAREVPTVLFCGRASGSGADAFRAAGVRVFEAPLAERGVDLVYVLGYLSRELRVATLMVEAGALLLGSLFEADLVDEAVVYISPLLLGDELAKPAASGRVAESLQHGRTLRLCRAKPLGADIEAIFRRPL